MKRFYNIGLVLVGLSVWTGCTKQELLMPTVEQKEEQGNIDAIAKPTDVTVVGQYDYKYIIKWPEMSDKTKKVVITYLDKGVSKSVELTDFTKDYTIVTTEEGDHEFQLVSYGENNLVSKTAKQTVANKGYIINEVITKIENPFFYEGQMRLNIPNPNLADIKIKVTYPVAAGGTSEVLTQSKEENIIVYYPIKEGQNTITVELEDTSGRKASKALTYKYYKTVIYNTAALKQGWVASVSSNQAGDGGGAPALIDGKPETFWHSPWSGTLPPWPHQATIDFNKFITVTKVMLNLRSTGGGDAPKDFDVQISTDGVNYTTYQSFTNTSSTANAVVSFAIAEPIRTRYVRLSFKNGFNASWVNLGEINFEGYIEQ